MSIYWVGSSNIWKPKKRLKRVPKHGYVFPLTERAVLETAYSDRYAHLTRLSKQAALRCVSRSMQREALDFYADLNPSWKPIPWAPGVFKAPASSANKGVIFAKDNDDTKDLLKWAPGFARTGVWEEFIEGEAWEIDGFVFGSGKNKSVYYFTPLRQMWNKGNDYIIRYSNKQGPPPGIHIACHLSLDAVGLENSAFCIELRYAERTSPGLYHWKIIEIHARLGEDRGLAKTMFGRDPIEYIESIVEEHENGSRQRKERWQRKGRSRQIHAKAQEKREAEGV